ncbi:MAG: crotonase/enoyl-CoA hydratase family protein [Gammaproteobacteria bacterium]|nr:crotonase/enoyl-CoA hydratase family protein [Gammaproteobacteria bacterium]
MEAISNAKISGQFEQIKLHMDKSEGILWLYMDPIGRPCFSVELVNEIISSHRTLMKNHGYYALKDDLTRVNYQVMTSMPGKPYNLGGDLELFVHCLQQRNRQQLTEYAKLCIDGLYPTSCNFHGLVTTIALVRGQALGGGFESALSSSVIVAERDARLGLPEVLFNLFPGMGAYQFLSRRLPVIEAERMIMSGKLYEAEELHDMGIVDVLAEPGEGEAAVYEFVRRNRRHHNTQLAMQKVRQLHKPVSYHELMRICHLWVDAAMHLDAHDFKVMERLLNAQYRMVSSEQSADDSRLKAIA